MLDKIIKDIYLGKEIDKTTALLLVNTNLAELCNQANEIRQHFCGNSFDLCSIINAKSGKCSENCQFCAQSAFHSTNNEDYPLLDLNTIKKDALHNAKKGVQRFSLVTSGKKLTLEETNKIGDIYQELHQDNIISLCASHGLLDLKQLTHLKASGVKRYHNNLETSARFFPLICSTHSYQDKIDTLKFALQAGLEVCSGGIIGLGETWEDRIDLALKLRELKVSSIPLNFLSPIKGTPLENNSPITLKEAQRVCAIFRFILPHAHIRLAGGRQLFSDMGASLFECGANATITGDMLTTSGISINEDQRIIKQFGYEVTKL